MSQYFLKDLEALGKQICLKSRTNSWAAAVELCTKIGETSNSLKVHGHLWVTINKMPLPLSTCTILDGQVRPFVNTVALTYLAGIASARSVGNMSGAFYCTIDKTSSILRSGVVQPFVDFPVKDTWITSMFVAGKVSYETARELYLKFVSALHLT